MTRTRRPIATPWWARYMRECRFVDGGRAANLVDCFGLLCQVYADQLGITLTPWPALTLETAVASHADLTCPPFTTAFFPVQNGFEQAFDAVVIRRPYPVEGRLRRGWWHVGVVTRPGHLLHMDAAMGVVEQPFRDTAEARGLVTLRPDNLRLFRHQDMMARAA